MPSTSRLEPEAQLGVDRASHALRLTRDLDASRAEIFAAWTKPEQVACWWDAAGEPLAVCEIDLRPGGAFKFVSKGHPEMPFTGVYKEIAPPDRLVFDAMGSTGRVTLREADGKTHMVVEIVCRSDEQLDQFLKMGVNVGTGRTLDNLVAYLRSRASRAA
jgi:uncharacterized protein YndB with AHSA1/START domain